MELAPWHPEQKWEWDGNGDGDGNEDRERDEDGIELGMEQRQG